MFGKKYIRYIKGFSAAIICGFALTACVDDKLILDEPDNNNMVEIDGDVLAFTVEMDRSLSSTRSMFDYTNAGVEDKDDWIDMQDKFRVFFFAANGDFLFGANDRIVGSIENATGQTSKGYWYVRIPMTMIVDRHDKEYDIAAIKAYLKANPFKVAVLANWPNKGEKVNPGDFDDSDHNLGNTGNESSILKGEPLWGWDNSVLNPEAVSNGTVRNINDLHHIFEDKVYAENQTKDSDTDKSRPYRWEVYSPFMKEYTDDERNTYWAMGQPTDWVKMRDLDEPGAWKYSKAVPGDKFESKEEANQWIREYWDPSMTVNENKGIYRHYQHLWFLWNFTAAYNIGKTSNKDKKTDAEQYYANNFGWNDGRAIGGTNNKWGFEWWERNGSDLYEWMKNHESQLGETNLAIGNANNSAFLEFIPPKKSKATVHEVKSGTFSYYGISLPVLENPGNSVDNKKIVDVNKINSGKTDESFGYFKFIARTAGTLRIKWSSADDKQAKLVIQKEGTRDKEYTISANNKNVLYEIGGTENSSDTYRDISVGEDSQRIFIWCSEGNAVIYSIEYIRGKYLYDTDREGIYPNVEQGIPMYGVQDYPAIPDWEYGTTHNLQGNVPLIRALAKVVIYLPEVNGLAPSHVYMRSMNRSARCEPMDVMTATDKLWYNDDGVNTHSKYTCEWFNIQKYGSAYKNANQSATKDVSDNSELTNYKNWLSWFYGSWKEWFNPTGVTIPAGVGDLVDENDKTKSDQYPHIFNPYINRSDFCSFLYVGPTTDGGKTMHKYVLYMPEKNIDDPNYPGVFTCTPKVPHIEFRYSSKEPIINGATGENQAVADAPSGVASDYAHTEFNLDDNSCYRVYFTNYGYDTGFNDSDASTAKNTDIRAYSAANYDTYEKNGSHLDQHWPIMRNHIYEFYVSSLGPENPEVAVKVTDWKHEKVVVSW